MYIKETPMHLAELRELIILLQFNGGSISLNLRIQYRIELLALPWNKSSTRPNAVVFAGPAIVEHHHRHALGRGQIEYP
jgi:hypothetical protein